MKSNYKQLSAYIRESNVRNSDGSITNLLGVNIDKYFMPSVANIVGTDLTVYKVVKNGQFACNRMHVGRDKRLPVALSCSDSDFIVSPAYDVFEIIDESVLNAEYLMMWFSRKEFDRNAWFYTDADVRGGLSWDAFINMQLPIPGIEKQKEIVKEYHTIVNRIKLNEQLNRKLEETAQAIYKQWFVDFEFPDENGNPYKSSGGEMIFDEKLEKEIPVDWKAMSFTSATQLRGGGTPSTDIPEYWDGTIPFFTGRDVTSHYYTLQTERKITNSGYENSSTKLYPRDTTFVVARGATTGVMALAGTEMAMNQSCYAITNDSSTALYTHQLTLDLMVNLKSRIMSGAIFDALVTKDFDGEFVCVPKKKYQLNYTNIVGAIYQKSHLLLRINDRLNDLLEFLLARMSKELDKLK